MDEISLHILDIVENSITAGSTKILLRIIKDTNKNIIKVIVKDNGKGMTPEQLKMSTNPFYSTKKQGKGGLGLALIKQTCEQCECTFNMDSKLGLGTLVEATMLIDHPDRPVMGDLTSTVVSLIAGLNENLNMIFEVNADEFNYKLDTSEIRKELDGMPLNHPAVMQFMKNDIKENIEDIFD